jgi:hypothetical protein
VKESVTESCVSAFRIVIAAMLQQSTSLENLAVQRGLTIALVTLLQHNTTLEALKTLTFYDSRRLRLSDDEDRQMASQEKLRIGKSSRNRLGQ